MRKISFSTSHPRVGKTRQTRQIEMSGTGVAICRVLLVGFLRQKAIFRQFYGDAMIMMATIYKHLSGLSGFPLHRVTAGEIFFRTLFSTRKRDAFLVG